MIEFLEQVFTVETLMQVVAFMIPFAAGWAFGERVKAQAKR